MLSEPAQVTDNSLSQNAENGTRAAGLVKSLKSHREETNAAIITVFADVTIIKRLPTPQSINLPHHGGIREPITDFTPASRDKFMIRLAQCVKLENGVFATLTYPADFPTDPAIFKRDLDVLLKALRRLYPTCGGFWRLEFQARGAPHYHLLVFGVPGNVKRFRQWLALAWYRIVGSGDEKHLRAGVQCDRIHNRAHAMRYATKYSLKISTQDKTGLYGRRWGQFGQLDQTPTFCGMVSYNTLIDFRRLVVAWLLHRVTQSGQPMRSARHFGARLKRSSARFGFRVFGLGDMSLADVRPVTAGIGTALRMVSAVRPYAWHATAPLPHIEAHRPRIERLERRRASDQWHKEWIASVQAQCAPINV